jgi:hypothetical protein
MLAFEHVSGVGVGAGEADAVGRAVAVAGATEGEPQAARVASVATAASALGVILRMPVIRAGPAKGDGGIVIRATRCIGSR